MSATGTLTYTLAATGSGVATVTLRLQDNGGGANVSPTQSFLITVTAANAAPVLAAIGNKAVDELAPLTFTATATDANAPPQTLTFSLDAGFPAGASITTGGAFSWTPTEAQGPGAYPATIRVSDGTLEDFETISITVSEVNLGPEITGVPATATIDELSPYGFDADATDGDLPVQTLELQPDRCAFRRGHQQLHRGLYLDPDRGPGTGKLSIQRAGERWRHPHRCPDPRSR